MGSHFMHGYSDQETPRSALKYVVATATDLTNVTNTQQLSSMPCVEESAGCGCI